MQCGFSLRAFPAALLVVPLFAQTASAACPLCFVTAGIGLLLARYFGLSMDVVGALSGAISSVLALWMHYSLKRWRFPWRPVVFTVLTVVLNNAVLAPGAFTSVRRFIYIVFQSPVACWSWTGAVLLFVGIMLSKAQKRAWGKTLFPYQSVVVTVVGLLVVGIAAYIGSRLAVS